MNIISIIFIIIIVEIYTYVMYTILYNMLCTIMHARTYSIPMNHLDSRQRLAPPPSSFLPLFRALSPSLPSPDTLLPGMGVLAKR